MKTLLTFVSIILLFSSCKNEEMAIVDQSYVDSLISNYQPSVREKINAIDLQFWKNRLDSLPKSYSNAQKYAQTLDARFRLYGDINDLIEADSINNWLNKEFKEKDAGIFRTLATNSMQQHRFGNAKEYIKNAINIGSEKYASELILTDAYFEMGQYGFVKNQLNRLKKTNNYGYFFALAKYHHWEGKLDSAIVSLENAVKWAGNNNYLKQIAISNLADLYLHSGELTNAAKFYKQSIEIDAADYHSLAGLAWIALVHDKKDTLAERTFRFIQSKTKSPDMYLKLAYIAQFRKSIDSEKKYAQAFSDEATKSIYGNMYNKYLIELYGGILDNPQKMLKIAEKELRNRANPQTYTWYAWALFKNNQQQKAFEIYDKYVSEQPLEGLELYYMGKMMQAANKTYNAKSYFEAAHKNRYDLSPKMIEEIVN
jgi:tetratricopeptide (TPR) repeat protein